MSDKTIHTQFKKLETSIKEAIKTVPIVEITGETRVFVENHSGISAYSQEEIQLKMQYGILMIKGKSLKLLQFGKEQIVISGIIDSLHIIRR